MKKIIGVVAFITAGLLAFIHEVPADVPAAQASHEAVSPPMSKDALAAQALVLSGCPETRPVCCEPIPDGCALCVRPGVQCP